MYCLQQFKCNQKYYSSADLNNQRDYYATPFFYDLLSLLQVYFVDSLNQSCQYSRSNRLELCLLGIRDHARLLYLTQL